MHLGYDLIEERASQFGKTISGLISAPVTGCNTNFIYKSDRHDCNLFLFYAKGYNYSPLFVISCIRKEQGCYRHSSCFLRKNLECRHQKYWYNPPLITLTYIHHLHGLAIIVSVFMSGYTLTHFFVFSSLFEGANCWTHALPPVTFLRYFEADSTAS